MKSIFKSVPVLGILALVLFCSNTSYATLIEYIGPFANSGKVKNVGTSFEDNGTYLATKRGDRKVTFTQTGAFVVDNPYIVLEQQPDRWLMQNAQFATSINRPQWVKFGCYVPGSAACGAITWVTIHIYLFENSSWNEVSATTYMVVASTPAISGTTPLCTTSGYYTLNGNGRTLQAPFNWTTSNPAFTITGNGQTVEIGSASNAVSTTITVTGGYLCQPITFELHRGTPPTPGNVWTDLIPPFDFHCFSGAFTENVSTATSYVWTSPVSEETLYPQSNARLTKNRSYFLSVRAKNACGLSGVVSSTETTQNCTNKTAGEEISADGRSPEFSVFPNPANTSFQINIPSGGNRVCVKIMNVKGQVVQNITTDESRLTVQTTDMPAGLYLINISSDELNIDSKIQVMK